MDKIERLEKFFDIDREVIFGQDGKTYNFYESSMGDGIMYDIYNGSISKEDIENGLDAIDGGLCTGGEFLEALKMAGVIN